MKIRKAKALANAIIHTPRGMIKQALEGIYAFYSRSACGKTENSIEVVCYQMRILTHVVEKALSLPAVKKGFGREKIKSLLHCLDQYLALSDDSFDPQAYDYAVAALRTYVENASRYECDTSFIDLDKYTVHVRTQMQCGIDVMDAEIYSKYQDMDFKEFAQNRHSIRSYSKKRVPENLLRDAVRLSQTAPSACNRQSARVIHIRDARLCEKVLEIQGGAKGHTLTELLLIASDLNLYKYYSERNTPYVDGGIYLMNLIYALTYYGIGTCPLIWDDFGEKGEKMRQIMNIPRNLHVIAVLQIGMPMEDECKYAISNRRESDAVFLSEKDLQ